MDKDGMPYDDMFVWNEYLTKAIRSRCGSTIWTIALVHGHFKQLLEKGVNDWGRVANEVETEQIVLDDELDGAGQNEFCCADAWINSPFLVARGFKI
ncbi:hypothetical protein GH714_021881 [Hevea brasiliensis]|uniref:SAC domain-containing protein n=1 Tax=Hevea brasiliensis TaxID=3981 RepID=A0A6A6LBF9_HEVBR|nr:hypothetical protein GH714_021881 [Hevea brasiliensis]